MTGQGSIDRTRYMTRREASAYLGVPFERLAPLVARGRLTGTRRGHWLYIERASAQAYRGKSS